MPSISQLLLAILALMALAVAPKYTIAHSAVADEKYSCQKDKTTDGARLALQEESNQIKHYKHYMRFHQSWIGGLG